MPKNTNFFSENIATQVMNLIEQKDQLEQKVLELQKKIINNNENIFKLKASLKFENLKNLIYAEIIKSQTNINLSEVIEENDNGIHIRNYENGNLPIIVHEYMKTEEVKNYTINTKKKIVSTIGKNYRTLKNRELAEENPEQVEEKVKQVEKNIEEMVQENNLDVPYKETLDLIKDQFDEILNSKSNSKYINIIMENRFKLLCKLTLTEYIVMIENHILKLKDIFQIKKYDVKKIETIISKSLSPLEKRLVRYGDYYNNYLEPDDIQKFEVSLAVNMNYPKRYIPFSITSIYNEICNYSVAIFPLKQTLKRIFVNPFGFNNLIFLDDEKTDQSSDAFSFYILEKINPDGKRSWKMECRIDDLSKTLGQYILSYCITLFRKIYFDIFKDNIYRADYNKSTTITQQDCEQLLINIITIIKGRDFCNMLRTIIKDNCYMKPGKIDKFNLLSDDKMNKKSFLKDFKYIEGYKSYFNQLFDNINDDNIENLINSKII